VVIPLVLFFAVSGTTFALAKLHPAKPGTPTLAKGTSVQLGDPYRGQVIFAQTCAPCHGTAGKGGGVGPTLAGDHVTIARVQAQIDNGGGAMPPNLVKRQKERDVLAYVATIVAPQSG
jgi:mono/diheme cytochrome c family protein